LTPAEIGRLEEALAEVAQALENQETAPRVEPGAAKEVAGAASEPRAET